MHKIFYCLDNQTKNLNVNFQRCNINIKTNLKKHILVAGGGPAGVKAACIAADRGHRVTLCEKSNSLGGQINLAQSLPGRAEFGGIITNLNNELKKTTANVRFNSSVNLELI